MSLIVLQSTAGVSYTYDADGNRVEKSGGASSTLYWYGAPGIIAESDLSGTLKSEYVFVNGKRAARIDLANNSVHYYLSDHLNSTSMVISSAGVPEDESDYSAFGTEYPVTSSGANHYKFSGKERDTESQLDYFGARYYSNAFGRFLTPDWAAKAMSVPYANFGDPQTLNLYGYVRNIPTSLVDGDGHGFVNEGFQDWGFELGDPAWGTQKGEDDAKAQANYQRVVQLYIKNAAAMATEQGAPHTYESSPSNPGFLDKLQAFFSADGIPDSRQYKLSLIRSMLDDLLGVKEVPNPATGNTVGDPPPGIPVPLKIIHLVPPLQGSASYQEWNKKSTQEIIESLDPKKDDGLKVYPDGAIANGNSRITILKERGVDVDRLPRDYINKAPVPDPIEPK